MIIVVILVFNVCKHMAQMEWNMENANLWYKLINTANFKTKIINIDNTNAFLVISAQQEQDLNQERDVTQNMLILMVKFLLILNSVKEDSLLKIPACRYKMWDLQDRVSLFNLHINVIWIKIINVKQISVEAGTIIVIVNVPFHRTVRHSAHLLELRTSKSNSTSINLQLMKAKNVTPMSLNIKSFTSGKAA
jgi:hypothetical protein